MSNLRDSCDRKSLSAPTLHKAQDIDSNFLELEVYYPELLVEPTLVQIRHVYQAGEQL